MISIATQNNLARLGMTLALSCTQDSDVEPDMSHEMKMDCRVLQGWGIMKDVDLDSIYHETLKRNITVDRAAAAVAYQIPKDVIESWRAQMKPFTFGAFFTATNAALAMLTPAWTTEIEGCRETDKHLFYEMVKESVDYNVGAEDIVLFQPPSAEHKETVELIMAKYLRYAEYPHVTEGFIDQMQTMHRGTYAAEWAKAWLIAVVN